MHTFFAYLLLGCSLATADTLLIKSVDGGRTWTDIDPGPPDQFLAWFSVDPLSSTLYALTRTDNPNLNAMAEEHLLVSIDGGKSWQVRQTIAPDKPSWYSPVATPASPDTLYLAYQEYMPYPRSATIVTRVWNNGQQTEQYAGGGLSIVPLPPIDLLGGGFLTGFAADPAKTSKLYALITDDASDDVYVYFEGLWTSEDGGHNWSRLQSPLTTHCIYPSMWNGPDSSVYLSCGEVNTGDFWGSTDGGFSWTQKVDPGGQRRWNLVIGPGSPGVLYTLDVTRAIWKSTDGAGTWQHSGSLDCGSSPRPDCPLPGNASLSAIHPSNGSVLFASGNTGIWESDDSGATWTELLASDGDSPWSVHIDPRTPGTIYASSANRQEARLNSSQTFLRTISGERQVAPGSLVSIYGQELTAGTQTPGSYPLPSSLAGASVSFNGQPAPLLFVSPGQVNAQAPFGLSGAVTMEFRRPDGSADRQTVTLSPRAVFILRESLTRQAPPLLFHGSDQRPVSAADPLHSGETVSLLASGMGELTPSIMAGNLPPTPTPQLRDAVCVGFWDYPADGRTAGGTLPWMPPLWAGAEPGQIGIYRVDYQLPAVLAPGVYTLLLENCLLPTGILDSVNVTIQ